MDKQQRHICILHAAGILLVALLAFAMSSCKTIKVVTEYRDRYVHDTTEVVDSIYQDRYHYVYEKGDTIFKVDSVYLYKYKYLDHDVEVYIHDSIPYPVEVEKPVRYRSGYDKFCSWAFWILIVLVLLRIAWWTFKKYYLHK